MAKISLTKNGQLVNGLLNNFKLVNPSSLVPVTLSEARKLYPNIHIPNKGTIRGKFKNNLISGIYSYDSLTTCNFTVNHSEADVSSIYHTENVTSWHDFTELIQKYKNENKYVFRGQPGVWRLRTGYHRTGRCDLMRYFNENIPALRYNISGYLNHLLDIKNNEDLSVLLNVVQHHGYPTPLLDWTFSPYVAAYFAFSNLSQHVKSVRIFVFDKEAWDKQNHCEILDAFESLSPNIYFYEFPLIYNTRAFPQQSITLFSNIDDIECYVSYCEKKVYHKKYLTIIELPSSLKSDVLQELSYMNITASSLFPGLDGICTMMKNQHFNT